MGAKAYQKSKIKKQNHNPKIKKAQQLVILSETKNLDCDTVYPCYGQILRLRLRMTKKIGPSGRNQWRDGGENLD
jgi:hypothetical protein